MFYGYKLHTLLIFQQELDRITTEVERLQSKDPVNFYNHPMYKLLMGILNNITDNIPLNPDHKDFRLGNTLGNKSKSWRRAKKKTLPDRYRLFFQFNSRKPKTIVYAWINDETTLRKAGGKTDVYHVFSKMVNNGKIPNTWQELVSFANPLRVS